MASSTELALILKAKDLASREVNKLHDSMDKAAKSGHGLAGKLKTVGFVAGGLAIAGVAILAKTLYEATQRAADEQKGITRLNAALHDNIKGWKGNTAWIEKRIAAQEQLGFSDDDQRNSLAQLVVRYKDLAKAQQVQTLAMDVARLKGIDLNAATQLTAKALDGNAKVLKQLGIQVPKNAKDFDTFAAIQKRVAGQAEKYGKTAAGAQEAFKIAMDDVIEDVGTAFLPIMTQFFKSLVHDVIPAIRTVIGAVQRWFADNKVVIDQIRTFITDVAGKFIAIISKVADVLWGNGHGPLAVALGFLGDALRLTLGIIGDIIGKIEQAIALAEKLASSVYHPTTAQQSAEYHLTGHHQAGGWVGLHGPELGVLGEAGPEYVIPNHQLRNGIGGQPVVIRLVVDGRQLAELVDEHLYYAMSRRAPTLATG